MGRFEEKILMLKVEILKEAKLEQFWVDGGIHAREWIAVATATTLDQIVEVFKQMIQVPMRG